MVLIRLQFRGFRYQGARYAAAQIWCGIVLVRVSSIHQVDENNVQGSRLVGFPSMIDLGY